MRNRSACAPHLDGVLCREVKRMPFSPGTRLVGLFVVAMSAALAAQTAQQRPTFRSGVDLIEVDVSVIDGDGRPIPDLEPSDFSVTVDGDPRRVVQAQFISVRSPEPDTHQSEPVAEEVYSTSSTSNIDHTPGRLIVIAVDEESILFGEGRHVMRAASEFVDRLSPSDHVALVAVPQPSVYVDFTLDHDQVSRAIAGMSGLGRRVVSTFNIGLYEAFQIAEHGDDNMLAEVEARICGETDVGGALVPEIGCVERIAAESRQIVQESRLHTKNMRDGLESILEALREVEGPKVLLWISGGHVVDGAEMTMRVLEDLVVEARTTVYVIMIDAPLGGDITQASSPPTPSQDRRMQEQGLHLAAAITRGTVFRAHFNPDPIFDRLEDEMSGYYLLGVESRPNDLDKARRQIEVSVQREGAGVRARREISFTPEDLDRTVDERASSLLRAPGATTGLPLRVATYAYQDTESEQMRVLVAAEVDVPASVPSALTLEYTLLDPDGTQVSGGQTQISPRVAQTPSGPVFEITFTLTVEPGPYALRFSVVDPAGQRGTVEHPVNAEPLSTGPLTIGDLMVSDLASSPVGGTVPPVEARVSGGSLLAYTELYAESSALWEEVELHFDVVDDATGPARAEDTMTMQETADPRRRVFTGDVSVAHLPPGQYVARAHVIHDAIEVALVRRPFRITE